MIFSSTPEGFTSRFEVVSCYVEAQNKILLLHRLANKSQGGKWGVPAGKIDSGETPMDAMVRELREETGLNIDHTQLEYLDKVFVRYPDYDFLYHMYRTVFKDIPEIKLNLNEHYNYRWEHPNKTDSTILVDDLDACIQLYY